MTRLPGVKAARKLEEDAMSAQVTEERFESMFTVEREARARGRILVDDPYPAFERLRNAAGVHKGGLAELLGLPAEAPGHSYVAGRPMYSAFSFKAVNEAFLDNETFSSEIYLETGVEDLFGDSILSMTGERHRRYRNVIQPQFQPAMAASWWNSHFIVGAVEALVSRIEDRGSADLIGDFFGRLPMYVVTTAFGLSPDQGVEFRNDIEASSAGDLVPPEQRAEAKQRYIRLLRGVIQERMRSPQDDVISKLAQAKLRTEDGAERPFSEDEILDHCRLIVFAGGGTTWRQLSTTMYALLNHPEQLDAVRADRSLIPQVVLESARWYPTDPLFPRGVTRDVKLDGMDLPAGAILHLCLGAANRDPSRWQNPDRFDIFRPMQRSLAFGAGAHSCLGQHVSRQEMTVALNAVFDRLPNLRWDDSKPRPRLWGGLNQRGPTGLPVVFG